MKNTKRFRAQEPSSANKKESKLSKGNPRMKKQNPMTPGWGGMPNAMGM
jgi:hypothetical protein